MRGYSFVNIEKTLYIWIYEEVTIEVFTRKLSRNVINKGFIISLQRRCTNFSYAYIGAESSSLKPSSLRRYFKSAIKIGEGVTEFKLFHTQFLTGPSVSILLF